MEDRLGDIKTVRLDTASSVTELKGEEVFLPEFSKKMSHLQHCYNRVKENNQKIYELKDKHIKATLSEQEKAISQELDSLINKNTALCKTLKEGIDNIELIVITAKKDAAHEPETRIQDLSLRALRGKFAEVLKETQTAQIDYKAAVKQKMGRQVKIMDPSLTPDQVEDICNDPDGADKLMQNKLMGMGHVKLKNAVSDIQDKHKDILKLERSVQTIHQMFVDMAMLVQQQGEMLDNIELNVQEAVDYVKKANKQLDKAKKQHIKSRKWKCCILITLLIVIMAVVIPIVLTKTL